MKYKGAAIQYDCHFMDKEKNLAALTNLVRQAAAQGAKLIVLPEMCATGYYFESMEQAGEDGRVRSKWADGRIIGEFSKGVRLLFSCRTS